MQRLSLWYVVQYRDTGSMDILMITIHNQEALEFCKQHSDDQWDMIFMDPPDNLGLDYGSEIDDKRSDYYQWLESIIFNAVFLAPIVWVSYYHKHDIEIKSRLHWLLKKVKPSWEARTFIWRFTFGQYNDKDCANGYRPILRLSRPGIEWNVDPIRVMSKRQLLGDPRAKGPRVPDDVWEFPRIVGNSPERRKWIPTQHPEALLERIVKMSIKSQVNRGYHGPTYDGKKPRVLELFSGSGTLVRVANKLNINLDTVELNGSYVGRIRAEHPHTVEES